MLSRPFGATGLVVPVLGFGAMQLGDPRIDDVEAGCLLNAVVDAGLTLIDTARSYGLSEERIGRHLARRRREFLLSTKVGYGVPGVADWTAESVRAGVDAALVRLATDVIDIVHLHSCPLEVLRTGDVVRALEDCVAAGKVRVAAYSGDGVALEHAAGCGAFRSLQASVNLCDQAGLPTLLEARAQGLGTIAKRSLAGRPWTTGVAPHDAVHAEYHRRFGRLRAELDMEPPDWDALALRFAAHAPGVDTVIVGGTNLEHLRRNVAAIDAGPLDAATRVAMIAAFGRLGQDWGGLV